MSEKENHTDILMEEIEYMLHNDDLYEVVSRTENHIVIRSLEVMAKELNPDIPIPLGFDIAHIMGRVLGRVMSYGKMTMEIKNIRAEDPKNDKIILTFDMTAEHKDIILKYIGTIEVIR